MIRSSSHSLRFSNAGKLGRYAEFLAEYRRVFSLALDKAWDGGLGVTLTATSIKIPKYLDYKDLDIDTDLSARALSSLVTQLSGVLSASVRKRDKLIWLSGKLKKEGKPTKHVDKKIHNAKLVKPDVSKINPELSSKNIQLCESKNGFDLWIRVASVGARYGSFYLPIKATKVSNKWSDRGKRLGSILLTDSSVNIRYNIPTSLKVEGAVVGADQGLKSVLTLSNGDVTSKKDVHGHSLESILDRVSRCKKGSKAFKKAARLRRNFINWSINQLNLSSLKEIRLEKVVNINFGKRASRKMQAWTETEIRAKVMSIAEEQDVLVTQQDCSYRSQRCHCCGNVRKANRKGETYSCKNCGTEVNSDLNAAKNHEADLPDLPWDLRSQKLNLGLGFFWNPNGIFSFDGVELKVPLSPN